MPATLSGKRYAQAVFEIAQEENQFENWHSGLKRIVEVIQNPELSAFLESSKVPFDLKRKIIEDDLQDIIPSALNLAFLLVAKGKIKIAPLIMTEYERLLDRYHGIEHAKITTAIALNDKDKEKIVRGLENLTRRKVVADLEVAPDIIGGAIIKIGDRLVDGSLKSQLEALKRSLVEIKK